jgi:RNA polymerase sigma factor (sigma-70 family)
MGMSWPMSPQVRDVDLLAEAEAGNEAAFGALFRRHAKAVYNHCFRRLGAWDAAEDATSLVFLEAWRNRGDMRPVGGLLLPWLLGVATNVCRNQSRAERRYEAAIYRLPRAVAEPDPAEDVASRLDDERRMKRVLAELALLSEADQDVIALVVMDGLSYGEAAVALGLPVGTVRSRLSRARERLAGLRSAPPPGDEPPVVQRPPLGSSRPDRRGV